jgi:hypothetical protein
MLINTTPSLPTVKQQMVNINTQAYNQLRMNFENIFRLLNTATDIQAVLDDWGTDGVALFQASAATIAYLQSINPSYVPPTTKNTYTFNNDGTVTLNK